MYPLVGNNEQFEPANLTIGQDSSPDTPFDAIRYCFNISTEVDRYKEGVEAFALSLQNSDTCVWLGRDRASVTVQANGGS